MFICVSQQQDADDATDAPPAADTSSAAATTTTPMWYVCNFHVYSQLLHRKMPPEHVAALKKDLTALVLLVVSPLHRRTRRQ